MSRALSLSVLATSSAVLLLFSGVSQAGQAVTQSVEPAEVTIIQAVPGTSVDVSLDGQQVASGAGVGDILGPFDLSPGGHEVTFAGSGVEVDSSLDVDAGGSTDVVLHLPAEVGGDPVVHSYAAPDAPIGTNRARVLLAHTATVAPADVRVDGQTVFTNIANGEFAEAELPAGTHEVALIPSAGAPDPILGPIDVLLEPRTLTMVYAYGNPRNGSMNVISHTFTLTADGTVQPTTIDTGSAGLAGDFAVTPFVLRR